MAITLVQYKRGYSLANLSSFCMKAEILLKLAGLDYEIEELGDPTKGPKAKLPFIRDNGKDIADSTFIEAHLEEAYGAQFYGDLSDAQKAYGHALARMCEERLYWVMVYGRWIEDAVWPQMSEFWFAELPPVLRSLIPVIARREVRKNLKAHGIGRHTRAEIYALGEKDVHALAHALGDSPFYFGESPTAFDAAIYPVVENVLLEALATPLLPVAQGHQNLKDYAARCRAFWFADLEEGASA
ncbi:MAG: glutathione S-transferase family protein [Pseudomonadota bacterium]